ncbi:MAG: calcium/sodium antiporter [Clostridia bacterium]|nr:calcium/sodium antiporter [Clostridia bacterium]
MFSFIPNEVFLLIFGFILLIKGGDWFVDAASSIAKRFHLPELLIGATVVSIGTTLPEVMTSVMAAAGGMSEIAYGNAIGSIICNTSLIAAITIAVKPGKADKRALVFPVCFFFGAMAFYAFNAYAFSKFDLWTGIVLLVGFVVYMIINVLNMKKNPAEELELAEMPEPEEEVGGSLLKDILVLLGGAVIIALGAELLKDNASAIAKMLSIPESVIGLTIVALGTSLPELVTAVTALMKGHGALSLGNIIGANIFNLVLVSGAAITVSPFAIPEGATLFGHSASLLLDIPVAFAVMAIMTLPALFRGKLARWQGISLLLIYIAYTAMQVYIAVA